MPILLDKPNPSGPDAAHAERAADVWALYGNRHGDNRLIETLAAATGLPWRGVKLRYNTLGGLPNLFSGGSLHSVRSDCRNLLAGPFPKVVITSGTRAVPAALWLKRMSAGKTRLVHVGRPQAPLGWFDLVITTPQYRLPERANVKTFRFPPTAPAPRGEPRADLAALPRPRIAVVVGGDAPPMRLDAETARTLARTAIERAEANGGSLMVATSPRTSKAAVAALKAALGRATVPVRLSVFGEGPNDYAAFMAAADELVVTNDSVSMVVEAAMTGAPVSLFALPERPDLRRRIVLGALGALRRFPKGRVAADALVAAGRIRSNVEIAGYMRGLESDQLLSGGLGSCNLASRELAQAAYMVKALIWNDT